MNNASTLQRKLLSLAVGSAMLGLALVASAAEPLRIGYAKWSDTELTSKLASTALHDQLGVEVKLIQADIGIHFQAMANGSIDLVPMVWLPNTHKAFYDKYKDKLEDLGVLYEGRIGLAVPEGVPADELASVADLEKPHVKEMLGGQILGSEVGNGQYKLSEKAIVEYGLTGYRIVASSEAGMLREMDRNIARGKWSVINAWSPHWMNFQWKLRYLDDPKQVFGATEQVHIVARQGFREQQPQIAHFFAHYTIPTADLEQLMMQARETSPDKAVAAYYAQNRARFKAMFAATGAGETISQQ